MEINNIYYKYYDDLYSSKNYKNEVKCIIEIAQNYYKKKINKVLEIGCGTGNHTIELAKYNFEVTALDIENEIFKIAEEKIRNNKIKNVKPILSPVEKLNESSFDLVIAMFNVVTYIENNEKLNSFVYAVSKRLSKGGLFIFDCWNGIAVLKDPPKSKEFEVEKNNLKISALLTNKTDFFNQKTTLMYNIKVYDKKRNLLEKGNFSFNQTLWTPTQIKYLLQTNNFKILNCCRNFEPETKASDKDFRIMFICKCMNN